MEEKKDGRAAGAYCEKNRALEFFAHDLSHCSSNHLRCDYLLDYVRKSQEDRGILVFVVLLETDTEIERYSVDGGLKFNISTPVRPVTFPQ